MTNTKNKRKVLKTRQPIYRRLIFIIPAIIIFILIIALVVWRVSASTLESSAPDDTPSTIGGNGPYASPETAERISEDEPAPKAIQYEGADPNQLEELTGSISYVSVENGSLFAAVTISQYLEQSGECLLSVVNASGETVASTKGTAHSDVTTSVCELPELSVANLPSGTYQVIIKLNADQKTGTVKEDIEL